MNQLFKHLVGLLFISLSINAFAQNEPNPFDFGKMWTFENPPKAWFAEAYDFEPEDAWWDDVRQSSLRFATWCSASFVSPDGLIMTNHHCSRDVAVPLQKEGEQFESKGFYAATRADERKAADLFVEQLVQVANITDEVLAGIGKTENDADMIEKRSAAIAQIQEKYAADPAWAGLRLQTVSYYSGGKFSLYGYKRYDDIRLVCIPELQLGFFGGDPDNFTYPRYSLDFTFWRAYDENGNPVNSSEHYFKFNNEGASEGEPVFVIGNPGSTERYRTVAQLEYDRDYRYPMLLKFLTNRHANLQKQYDAAPNEELLGTIFSLGNSMKAIGGIIGGLHDDELFGRKVAMEQKIKNASNGLSYWDDLDKSYEELEPHAWAINHLAPSGLRGSTLRLLHSLYGYEQMLKIDTLSKETREEEIASILELIEASKTSEEKNLFKMNLTEIQEDIYPGDQSLSSLLDGKGIDAYMGMLYKNSDLFGDKAEKYLNKKPKKFSKDKDPLLQLARVMIPKYNDAANAFRSSSPYRRGLETKIANQAFQVFGDDLPPDATFTLRIADGVVKGYEYNGTEAPAETTYFGLYDRYYSNDKNFPWSLPEKWMDPSMDLLKSPINFVSTNDITGGNSGSAVINKNKEVVGLAFDGNIESLPGNFIFDDTYNRTVSVHAGGIIAALKYIYGAEELAKELLQE